MDAVRQWIDDLPEGTVAYALAAAGAVVVLLIILRLLRRGAAPADERAAEQSIDFRSLKIRERSPGAPVLEFYNVPVRLALVVMAPTGRAGAVPPEEQLPAVVDQVTPGLMEVFENDRPLFCRWPAQLSWQGFANSLFAAVALPGEGGQGTPWCAAAGRIECGGQKLLLGLVMVGDAPNGLSQIVIDHPRQWLDVLRVRHPRT